MITGIDISGYSTVNDIQAVVNGQLPIEFAMARGYNGFRDDSKFVAHRKLLEGARNASGSVLWGAYMYLGYSAQVGSNTWTASAGDAQASNFWSLITAGGKTFQMPAAIDVEENAFLDEAKVRQVVPMPSAEAYCDAYLLPAVQYLTRAMGRRPILYTNPNKILYYLAPALRKEKYKQILECPLWLASYTRGTAPGYMDKISEFWPDWLIWQYAGDVRDWPGCDDLDLNRIKGTRAQLKAWCNDPSAPLPKEGGSEPQPEPKPEPVGDIAQALAAINAKLDGIGRDVTAMRVHYRP